MSIKSAFEQKSKKTAPDALSEALTTLEKSAAGRESLGYLDKLGYSVGYCPELAEICGPGAMGVCMSDRKMIAISPNAKAEDLPSIIVHEAQHAVQFTFFPEGLQVENTQIGDMFKFRRAMEADACAHQAAYAYETGTKMPLGYDGILTAYRAAMEKGDKKSAMASAFKEWYKNPDKQDFYDSYYADATCAVAKDLAKKGEKGFFTHKKSDKEWASMFLFEDKPYIEPEFLSSDQAFCLKNKNKTKLMKAMRSYSEKTGTPLDSSVMGMFDYSAAKKKSEKTLSAPARKKLADRREGR